MRKLTNFFIYLIVGVVSFLFFLYLSFPYSVLKENIAVQMSNTLGVSVSIKELGPRLMVGLTAGGVQLTSASSKTIEFKKLSAQLSLLHLLLLRVQVNVQAVDSSDGVLNADLGLGILDLIAKKFIPSSIEVNSEKFAFGNLAELALKIQAASPGTNPFIRPVLEKISVVGRLNSKIEFSLNTSDFSRSTGTVNLTLTDASVDFDPAMQIPSQKFESAVIKGNSSGGSFTFDPLSRFKTKDLDISFTGKVIEKTKIEQSIVDMEIKVQVFHELKNTFSVVLNAMAGKDIDGKLNVKISGPIVPSPDVKFL